MKHGLLLFLFIGFYFSIQAQTERTNFFYMNNQLNIGNYAGWEIGLNYVQNQKTSYKLSYTRNSMTARSTPDDFSVGLLGSLTFGAASPWDRFRTYQFAVGRIIPFNKSGSIRTNFYLGLGYSIIKEPRNWRDEGGSWLVPNYDWDNHKYSTLSISINPVIEFAFTRSYGLFLSPMLQLSKDRTYVGVGIGHMIGPIRNRIIKE